MGIVRILCVQFLDTKNRVLVVHIKVINNYLKTPFTREHAFGIIYLGGEHLCG